ncbi:MAG TPA: SAF domain-containing protein, partial [Longimicrobiales bacterium]|nr:SAF domain-containing protein [Longimicrobiales bacterium]
MAVAALLAFTANLLFLRSVDDATPVVVAARSIDAGQVVTVEDLKTARIRAGAEVMDGLVASTEGLAGRVARRDLRAGELVGTGDLLAIPAPQGLVSMAVPVDPAHAAGDTIRVGDRVGIVDVDDSG